MMPTIEPTPPIRELPDDDEQDVDRLTSKYQLPDNLEPEMRAIEWEMSDLMGGGITFCDVLRAAIRAALDDEWDQGFRQAVTDHVELVETITALRERCERLRTVVNRLMFTDANLLRPHEEVDLLMNLPQSDLADDLWPRE
jgi:hypothetical protein